MISRCDPDRHTTEPPGRVASRTGVHIDDQWDAVLAPTMVGGAATVPAPPEHADPLTVGVPDLADLRVEIRDTDGDGHADTVAVTGPATGSVLFSDVDGDGRADVATAIAPDGAVTVSDHGADGQWTVVERGRAGLGTSFEDHPAQTVDGSAGSNSSERGSAGIGSAAPRPVMIDPATGEWTEI